VVVVVVVVVVVRHFVKFGCSDSTSELQLVLSELLDIAHQPSDFEQ
jgi:hypothetical protein